MGLIQGMALDSTGDDVDGLHWDFNDPEKTARAEKLVRGEKALLLSDSPMCSALSQIQGINFCKKSQEDAEEIIRYGKNIWESARTYTRYSARISLTFYMNTSRTHRVGKKTALRNYLTWRGCRKSNPICAHLEGD